MSLSTRALGPVRELLRMLSSGRQVFELYPDGHPNREQTLRRMVEQVRAVQDVVEDPVLFVVRHSFYLGSTLLARESLSLFRLVEAFEQRSIDAVEFGPGVAEPDLDALVGMLVDERPVTGQVGAIHVNRVEPTVADDGGDLDLSDLRRTYALGLELLRETAVRVVRGRSVDLEAATGVVEQLSREVARDPAQALLLTTVKSHDEYTYYHMLNVCLMSVALGQAIGLRPDQVTSLGLGGLLHDVGKVHTPEDVLNHVGALTEEQWRIVQRHPVDGAGLIFSTGEGLLHPAASVALEHHAAYDRSGYPALSGRPQPSMPARLVSVADCFDAVTSKRAYRAPADRRQALAILEAGAGRGFDPRIVRVFVGLLGLFPVGSLVQLDTGEVGLVTRNHDALLARPTVLIVLDAAGNVAEGEERDLSLRDASNRFRWDVVRTVDPDRVGIDVMTYLTTGELGAPEEGPPTGLVHEPSPGEDRPESYVDTHNEPGHVHPHPHLEGEIDPDLHPPI